MLILLATMNENKVDEIKKIVPEIPFKNIGDFSDKWDVEEDGDSFDWLLFDGESEEKYLHRSG